MSEFNLHVDTKGKLLRVTHDDILLSGMDLSAFAEEGMHYITPNWVYLDFDSAPTQAFIQHLKDAGVEPTFNVLESERSTIRTQSGAYDPRWVGCTIYPGRAFEIAGELYTVDKVTELGQKAVYLSTPDDESRAIVALKVFYRDVDPNPHEPEFLNAVRFAYTGKYQPYSTTSMAPVYAEAMMERPLKYADLLDNLNAKYEEQAIRDVVLIETSPLKGDLMAALESHDQYPWSGPTQ
jgi:hypothetical protein